MTEAERVWSAYIDAWNSHDIDAIVAAVAEQFIYDERPMTMTTPIRGRQAFREYLKTVLRMFPDLRIQTISCDTGSSVAVAESVMSGTYAGATGAPLANGSLRAWLAYSRSPGVARARAAVLGPRQRHASARAVARTCERCDNAGGHVFLNAPRTESFAK